jgi:hypothetical protein
MYTPDYKGGDISHALLYTEKRLGGASLRSLEPGTDVTLPIRRVSFNGSTSQAVVIYMPQNGCLRVLEAERGDVNTYARRSRFLVDAIPLSNPSNIVLDGQGVRPPFVSEPKHEWCYYFAKAEIAYQQKDLRRVVELIDKAKSLGYEPEDPFEWLTYIEAQALAGDRAAAEKLSHSVFKQDNSIRKGLCEVWKRVQANDQAQNESFPRIDQILSDFQCTK